MGQAKIRGTFEERKAAAIRRNRTVELRPNTERLRVRVGVAAAGMVMVASIIALAL